MTDKAKASEHDLREGSKEVNERLQQIKQREQAATPGDWRVSHSGRWERSLIRREESDELAIAVCSSNYRADGEFIKHARSDIPWLLAENQRLQEQLAEQHSQVDVLMKLYHWCPSVEGHPQREKYERDLNAACDVILRLVNNEIGNANRVSLCSEFRIVKANKDCFKIFLNDYFIGIRRTEADAEARIQEMKNGKRKEEAHKSAASETSKGQDAQPASCKESQPSTTKGSENQGEALIDCDAMTPEDFWNTCYKRPQGLSEFQEKMRFAKAYAELFPLNSEMSPQLNSITAALAKAEAENQRLAKELSDAREEMSKCDDIKLDQPLHLAIFDLQRTREAAESKLGKMREALILVRSLDPHTYPTADPAQGQMSAREFNSAEYWQELVREEMMQLIPNLEKDSDMQKMAMAQLRLAEKMLVMYAKSKPVEAFARSQGEEKNE